jgi:hypothetical protein
MTVLCFENQQRLMLSFKSSVHCAIQAVRSAVAANTYATSMPTTAIARTTT